MSTAKALKRSLVSFLLAAGLLSGCAYRVQTSSGIANDIEPNNSILASGAETETKEETFYHADVIRLSLPVVDPGSEYKLIYTGMDTPVFTQDRIVVPLYRYFASSSEVVESVWGPGVQMTDSIDAVYDYDGHYVCTLQFYNEMGMRSFFGQDESGTIIGLYCWENYDEEGFCYYQAVALGFSQDTGEVVEGPIVLADMDTPLTGAVISGRDRIVFCNETSIKVTDMSGNYLNEYEMYDGSCCVGLWEENGRYYAEYLSGGYNNETGTLISFDVSESSDLIMHTDSKNTDNIAGMNLFQNDAGIYAATRNTLGKLDLQTGEFSRLLDWNQTDVDRSLLVKGNVRVLTEGERSSTLTVLPATEENAVPEVDVPETYVSASDPASESAVTEEETGSEEQTTLLVATSMHDQEGDVPCLVRLTPANSHPHAGEKVVWIGGVGISESPLMTYIAQYNQDPEHDVWVKIYDYSDFSVYFDENSKEQAYQDALENMATQVRSGVGPDIIVGMGQTGIFDNGSCLTDLNGYVDGIRGIDRSEYFDTVFRAFETNGKMYQIPLAYTVYGVLGNRSFADGKEAMNYNDYTSARTFMPEDMAMMPYYPTDLIMTLYSEAEMSSWINYDRGTVSFNHEALISMLELMRVITNEVGVFSYGNGISLMYRVDAMDACDAVGTGFAAFCPGKIDSILDFATGNVLAEQSMWYGFPGTEGCSSVIEADMTCGITSYSSQKEAAWDVIAFLLSESVQKDLGNRTDFQTRYFFGFENRIPVNIDAFESVSANDGGNRDLMIEMPDYSEGATFSIIPLGTADKATQDFIQWMSKPQRRLIYDPEVLTIVLEETEKYINETVTVTQAAESIKERIMDLVASR